MIIEGKRINLIFCYKMLQKGTTISSEKRQNTDFKWKKC